MVYPAPGTQTSVALCWFLPFVPHTPVLMFKILHLLLALSLLFPGTVRAQSLRVTSGEWPQWRGPNRHAVSTETGLLREWPEGGPPLKWRTTGLGAGYSTLAISGANVFTMGQRDEIEYLIALDLATGKEIWASKVGVGKPNSTPTVHGNRVYALGYDGSLICADAITGREIWRRHLVQNFGGTVSTNCGFSESPLVDGQLLVCTPGSHDAALVALDKDTGQLVWKAKEPAEFGPLGNDGAGYASIVVSQACGVRQYVQLVGRGLISVAASGGETLWTYNRIANWGGNVPTPIVRDDYVFSSTSYETGSVLLQVLANAAQIEVKEVYFLPPKTMQNHHGGMVLVGGHIYSGHGNNNGFPLCIEMKTGNVAWRPGRGPGTGSASVVYADGHLYFRYENGVMALIEATPNAYILKSTFNIPSNQGKGFPHPVVAGRSLFLRDEDVLFCYDLAR